MNTGTLVNKVLQITLHPHSCLLQACKGSSYTGLSSTQFYLTGFTKYWGRARFYFN